jgi:hypothetical protein
MSEKKILIAIIIATALGLGFFIYNQVKPKVGQQFPDLGRGHVQIGTKVDYNSNPPTSGPHYEVWIKSGVYSDVKEDRNLVHSLEHGYIVMSYNCDYKTSYVPSLIPTIYAQQMESSANPPAASDEAALQPLPESFKSQDCQNLVKELTQIYEDNGKTRLIVVPRPNLDAKIALTAWRYLDKFNDFDKNRINSFIGSHINQGPEKTVE